MRISTFAHFHTLKIFIKNFFYNKKHYFSNALSNTLYRVYL